MTSQTTPIISATTPSFGGNTLRVPGKYNGTKNVTMTEVFNRAALTYIVSNFDSLPFRSATNKTATKTNITKYLRQAKHGSCVSVVYNQCRHGTGRYFAKGTIAGQGSPSLQGICREIRHSICNLFYDDLDIENAHPNFLLQYCQAHNIACPLLYKYVHERATILNEIMGTANIVKEAAKKAILSIINGGSGDRINHPYLDSLKAEMAIVHGFIVNLNPSYYKIAKRQKEAKDSTFNINGSTVNLLLCDIENDLIQEVCEKLSSMGYTIGSLQFDGVLVRKHQTLKLTDEVLREITDTIYSQTGYRISLKVKPMDAGFSVPAEAVTNPEPMQEPLIAQDAEGASAGRRSFPEI